MRASVDFESLERVVQPMSSSGLAAMVGVSRWTVSSWKESGRIPVSAADRIACELGLHVLNIWPDFHGAYSR